MSFGTGPYGFTPYGGVFPHASTGALTVEQSNTTWQVFFPFTLDFAGAEDLANYVIEAGPGAVPITVLAVSLVYDTPQVGSTGEVLPGPAATPLVSFGFDSGSGVFAPDLVGDFFSILSHWNQTTFARLTAAPGGSVVSFDRALLSLDPQNGSLLWAYTPGLRGVVLTTTKPSNGKPYTLHLRLRRKTGLPFVADQGVLATSPRPKVADIAFNPGGEVVITFTDPMRMDDQLMDPREYSITGPTEVQVQSVQSASPSSVLLQTYGMGPGAYQVVVNAIGTPKDLAGNPMDPIFNQAIFTADSPLVSRSVYTDRGPLARPSVTVETGTGVTFLTTDTLTLTGASLSASAVGLFLKLTGAATNDGTCRIVAVLAANKLKVLRCFHLPTLAPLATWEVFDPRDGEIADDPAHVTVLVNGLPVVPEAVVGLLGQIVLPTTPVHGDTVVVDYSVVCNPIVEIRRLNSLEFHLNNWKRENGQLQEHKYRYSNVLPVPTNFLQPQPFQQGSLATVVSPTQIALADGTAHPSYPGLNIALLTGPNAGIYDIVSVPNATHVNVTGPLVVSATPVAWTIGDTADLQARLPQPLQRDLKYRAYERAYTAVLNDPNLLTLNAPTNSVAYPNLQRYVTSSFISYQPSVLPENASPPWARVGSGVAAIVFDELVVGDVSNTDPIFWTRTIDLTFKHVFAATWSVVVNEVLVPQGVFTGVAIGYTDDTKAVIIGFLLDGGVRKVGILKKGAGNDPVDITSWVGGLGPGSPPVEFDWSTLHSYRLYRDPLGTAKVYFDGDVTETLLVTTDALPFLEELDAPFDEIQGIFFGSLAKPTVSTSTWDFVRYLILPLNPLQVAPTIFVEYEGTTIPETPPNAWIPIGYHGTETILLSDFLLLDSTSARPTPSEALVGGDFRGYIRLEPLLATSAEVVMDVNVQLRTWTHGVTPNALMAAIDDGTRLVQLCFFSDTPAPKISYGGNGLPTDQPTPWTALGTQTGQMVGRTLRITDTSLLDGLVYVIDDLVPVDDPARVVQSTWGYILEARVEPLSYTADVSGFVGAVAQVFDSTRTIGFYLKDLAGVRSVVLQGDGVVVADVPFEWLDGMAHTFRVVYSAVGSLVTLFIDGTFQIAEPYASFPATVNPVGFVSFGSSLTGMQVLSVVDWIYVNAWRVQTSLTSDDTKYFVGIWKGTDSDSLVGYHLPLKASGKGALIVGNALADPAANFVVAGVNPGDYLIVDFGANKGVYAIVSVAVGTLTIGTLWPSNPSVITYRIAKEQDWRQYHRYRMIRDPSSSAISVLLDMDLQPYLRVEYDNSQLPSSKVGIPYILGAGLPNISWGAFDPMNLSQSSWDYVRYGITRSPTELRIAPHHMNLNQRNVIASFEHHRTNIPHPHTDFWSESEGIPPQSDPDLFNDPGLTAWTLLNDSTPLVPATQTFEIRKPTPVAVFLSGLNKISDVLNSPAFTLNAGDVRISLVVPDDVLYTSLVVTERDTGETSLLAPLDDDCGPQEFVQLQYQNEVCLKYLGDVLPELDPTPPTPWTFDAVNPAHVTRSAFAGILTYGTDGTGTKTIYKNVTPLPDAPSLQTEIKFRFKLLSDSTGGFGDSQVRVGFSAFGLTAALAFITGPTGQRYVLILDLNAQTILGGTAFDFLDGNYHTYRIVRNPTGMGLPPPPPGPPVPPGVLQVFIDS